MGGGGPASFTPRTPEQRARVSGIVDGAVAVVSGIGAAAAVSPFLATVDRAVVAAAAGNGGVFRHIARGFAEFVTKPRAAFTSPALGMVVGVYGLTYAAANVSDVVGERRATPCSI